MVGNGKSVVFPKQLKNLWVGLSKESLWSKTSEVSGTKQMFYVIFGKRTPLSHSPLNFSAYWVEYFTWVNFFEYYSIILQILGEYYCE